MQKICLKGVSVGSGKRHNDYVIYILHGNSNENYGEMCPQLYSRNIIYVLSWIVPYDFFPMATSKCWSILSYTISFNETKSQLNYCLVIYSLPKWVQPLVNYSYNLPSFVTYLSQFLAYDQITLETNGFFSTWPVFCGYNKIKHIL